MQQHPDPEEASVGQSSDNSITPSLRRDHRPTPRKPAVKQQSPPPEDYSSRQDEMPASNQQNIIQQKKGLRINDSIRNQCEPATDSAVGVVPSKKSHQGVRFQANAENFAPTISFTVTPLRQLTHEDEARISRAGRTPHALLNCNESASHGVDSSIEKLLQHSYSYSDYCEEVMQDDRVIEMKNGDHANGYDDHDDNANERTASNESISFLHELRNGRGPKPIPRPSRPIPDSSCISSAHSLGSDESENIRVADGLPKPHSVVRTRPQIPRSTPAAGQHMSSLLGFSVSSRSTASLSQASQVPLPPSRQSVTAYLGITSSASKSNPSDGTDADTVTSNITASSSEAVHPSACCAPEPGQFDDDSQSSRQPKEENFLRGKTGMKFSPENKSILEESYVIGCTTPYVKAAIASSVSNTVISSLTDSSRGRMAQREYGTSPTLRASSAPAITNRRPTAASAMISASPSEMQHISHRIPASAGSVAHANHPRAQDDSSCTPYGLKEGDLSMLLKLVAKEGSGSGYESIERTLRDIRATAFSSASKPPPNSAPYKAGAASSRVSPKQSNRVTSSYGLYSAADKTVEDINLSFRTAASPHPSMLEVVKENRPERAVPDMNLSFRTAATPHPSMVAVLNMNGSHINAAPISAMVSLQQKKDHPPSYNSRSWVTHPTRASAVAESASSSSISSVTSSESSQSSSQDQRAAEGVISRTLPGIAKMRSRRVAVPVESFQPSFSAPVSTAVVVPVREFKAAADHSRIEPMDPDMSFRHPAMKIVMPPYPQSPLLHTGPLHQIGDAIVPRAGFQSQQAVETDNFLRSTQMAATAAALSSSGVGTELPSFRTAQESPQAASNSWSPTLVHTSLDASSLSKSRSSRISATGREQADVSIQCSFDGAGVGLRQSQSPTMIDSLSERSIKKLSSNIDFNVSIDSSVITPSPPFSSNRQPPFNSVADIKDEEEEDEEMQGLEAMIWSEPAIEDAGRSSGEAGSLHSVRDCNRSGFSTLSSQSVGSRSRSKALSRTPLPLGEARRLSIKEAEEEERRIDLEEMKGKKFDITAVETSPTMCQSSNVSHRSSPSPEAHTAVTTAVAEDEVRDDADEFDPVVDDNGNSAVDDSYDSEMMTSTTTLSIERSDADFTRSVSSPWRVHSLTSSSKKPRASSQSKHSQGSSGQPRLVVGTRQRKRNDQDDQKEVVLQAEPGHSASLALKFSNRKEKPLIMRTTAIQVRFDDRSAGQSSAGSASPFSAGFSAFGVAPKKMEILRGEEGTLQINFTPDPSRQGIYTGVLKIKCDQKTFVILLRGEALLPAAVTSAAAISDSESSPFSQFRIETSPVSSSLQQPEQLSASKSSHQPQFPVGCQDPLVLRTKWFRGWAKKMKQQGNERPASFGLNCKSLSVMPETLVMAFNKAEDEAADIFDDASLPPDTRRAELFGTLLVRNFADGTARVGVATSSVSLRVVGDVSFTITAHGEKSIQVAYDLDNSPPTSPTGSVNSSSSVSATHIGYILVTSDDGQEHVIEVRRSSSGANRMEVSRLSSNGGMESVNEQSGPHAIHSVHSNQSRSASAASATTAPSIPLSDISASVASTYNVSRVPVRQPIHQESCSEGNQSHSQCSADIRETIAQQHSSRRSVSAPRNFSQSASHMTSQASFSSADSNGSYQSSIYRPNSTLYSSFQTGTDGDYTRISQQPRSGVFFRKDEINFGSVDVGKLTRMKIELVNNTDNEVTLFINEPTMPFVLVHTRVAVPVRSYVRVPVRFVPVIGGRKWKSELLAQTSDGTFQARVGLIGNSYSM